MEVEKSRAKRRFQTQNVINKQVAIAKHNGTEVKEPGRLKKHHTQDCGVPQCKICGNPRHGSNSRDAKTIQELRSEESFSKIEIPDIEAVEAE